MDSVVARLPAILGSAFAFVVGCISFIMQTPATLCVYRATAAFVVFAAIGVVIRYLLGDAVGKPKIPGHGGTADVDLEGNDIAPGTKIGDLLNERRDDVMGGHNDSANR